MLRHARPLMWGAIFHRRFAFFLYILFGFRFTTPDRRASMHGKCTKTNSLCVYAFFFCVISLQFMVFCILTPLASFQKTKPVQMENPLSFGTKPKAFIWSTVCTRFGSRFSIRKQTSMGGDSIFRYCCYRLLSLFLYSFPLSFQRLALGRCPEASIELGKPNDKKT